MLMMVTEECALRIMVIHVNIYNKMAKCEYGSIANPVAM
jgi:hypothetical protein